MIVLYLKIDWLMKKIFWLLEWKFLIEFYVEDMEIIFIVYLFFWFFVNEKKRIDKEICDIFFWVKFRFYYLKIKCFVKVLKMFLIDCFFGVFFNYWKKGFFLFFVNDKFFWRVVEVLFKVECFFYVVWCGKEFFFENCYEMVEKEVKKRKNMVVKWKLLDIEEIRV